MKEITKEKELAEWTHFGESMFYKMMFKPYLDKRKIVNENILRRQGNTEFDIVKDNITANTEINFINILISKIEKAEDKLDKINKKQYV